MITDLDDTFPSPDGSLIVSEGVARAIDLIRCEAVTARLGYAAKFAPWKSEYTFRRFGPAFGFQVLRTPISPSSFRAVWRASEVCLDLLDEMLAWFEDQNVEMDVLPFDSNSQLYESLQQRDFHMSRNHAVLIQKVGSHGSSKEVGSVVLERLNPGERNEAFSKAYIRCGGLKLKEAEMGTHLSLQYEDLCWQRYIAVEGGRAIGFATMYVSERSLDGCGKTAYLTNAATHAGSRCRGVQRLLIERRLRDARELGASHAIVCCHPFSGSFRNLQRCGFRLAYLLNCWERTRRASRRPPGFSQNQS